MSAELNLEVPKTGKKSTAPSVKGLTFVVTLLCVLSIVQFWLHYARGSSHLSSTSGNGSSGQRDLALKLESQGLTEQAVREWAAYTLSTPLLPQEAAKIWYRIGKLQQEAGSSEEALSAFYRSESIANVPELATDLSRRIGEALEASGRMAALSHELAERTEIVGHSKSESSDVIAEIGNEKITTAAFERYLEQQIDVQLNALSRSVPVDVRNAQKEKLLQSLRDPKQRSQALERYILEEILYRKALSEKLDRSTSVRRQLNDMRRSFLATKLMEEELAQKITLTESDLTTYYEAHKAEFAGAATAEVAHILVNDVSSAETLLGEIKNGTPFEEVASRYSLDEETKASGGKIPGVVEKNAKIPELGYSDEAVDKILSGKSGELLTSFVTSEKGVHIIKVLSLGETSPKDFSEVRLQIYKQLRGTKERELQTALLTKLQDEYDVVIHRVKLQQQGNSGQGK